MLNDEVLVVGVGIFLFAQNPHLLLKKRTEKATA